MPSSGQRPHSLLDAATTPCYGTVTMNAFCRFQDIVSMRAALLICTAVFLVFAFGACKKQKPGIEGAGGGMPGGGLQKRSGQFYKPDMENCNGFTASDAAAIMGLHAAEVTSKTEEFYEDNWQCRFDSGDAGKTMLFNVSVAKSVEAAANDMKRYRSHLATAGSAPTFKESLPQGAYREIPAIGDEAVWTDMNASLAARRGNVTIHVSMPKDKAIQIKIAEKFLSTLQ